MTTHTNPTEQYKEGQIALPKPPPSARERATAFILALPKFEGHQQASEQDPEKFKLYRELIDKLEREFQEEIASAEAIKNAQRELNRKMMAEATNLPLFALPTPGMPQLVKGQVTYDSTPEYFAKAAYRLFEEGAKVVGGCCGVGPEHILALKSLLIAGDEPPPVWPYAEGTSRGIEFKPLYAKVPLAAEQDGRLYEILALLDAIRDGRARERSIAERELIVRLGDPFG